MAKKILFILLLYCLSIYSQEKVTIKLKNSTIKSVIDSIEKKTTYKFYFIDKWIQNKKIEDLIFEDTDINLVLNNIFKETDINYFIFENKKIILTKNIRIFNPKKNDSTPQKTHIVSNDDNYLKIGKAELKTKERYELTGYVKDKTNKPIPNAIISNSIKDIYTSTNNYGYFKILLPFGKNELTINSSGHQLEIVYLNILGTSEYNFYLIEKFENLDEIEIEANKKNNIKEVISGTINLKAEKIKLIPQILGERDLLKVATSLPGIKTTNEASQGYNVRGGKSDQNLFLVDNNTIYNPSHFFGLFSAINPFVSNNLNVFKGNIPAKYGERISSVFNIQLKNSNYNKYKGEISVGPVTGNAMIDAPIIKNKSGIILGTRATYSDWLLKILDNEKLKNSSASFYDFTAKYSHKIDTKNNLDFTSYYSFDKFKIASDSTNSYSNKVLAVNWKRKLNDNNFFNLKVSNSTYSFEIDYDSEKANNFIFNYDLNDINARIDYVNTNFENHKIEAGIDSKLYTINPGKISPKNSTSNIKPITVNKEKAITNSVYVSDNFKVSNNLSISTGLRFSMFNNLDTKSTKKYNDFSSRLSARYSLSPELSIKASFNNSKQFIHRLSNNLSASPTDRWKLSDDFIKPQEGNQFSLGLFKNISDYEFSIETYYKTFKNILDYKTGADLLINEDINSEITQGNGKSFGIEFLASKKYGRLNGWFGYTYSRSLLQFNNNDLSKVINNGKIFPSNYDKPHDFSLVLNYKITKRYSFSANCVYQTGRPITYPTGKFFFNGSEYFTYSNRNEYRLNDYFRIDVGFNVEGNHKKKKIAHSFWNISIYNVLGRDNISSLYFTSNKGEVKAYKASIFAIPVPTITYNLKF